MKPVVQIGVLAAAVLITGAATWHFARGDLRAYEVEDTLQPISALLDDNKRIVELMKKDGMIQDEAEMISAYLADVRKDGVPKHAAMKQRIDTIANNNTMILALLARYSPRARTAEFRVAAGKYSDYAAAFRDRWQSVFETFMAGGNLPSSMPSDSSLSDAVTKEMGSP